MPTAFVTGAAGAIGRHCVAELRRRGWTVGGIGHGNVNWTPAGGIDAWIAGDVSADNLDLLAERIGTPELIVNLAGGSSVGASMTAPLGDFERSTLAAVRVLNWVWKHAPDAAISFASSAAVYGDSYRTPIGEDATLRPLSPYGLHKLMMEDSARFWGHAFGVRSAVVRLFSIYGPGLRKQLVYDLCTRLAPRPEQITLSGTGAETRDWLWIEDAAAMMIDLGLRASAEVPAFNGCAGVATSTAAIAGRLAELWGGGTRVAFDGISRAGDPLHLEGDDARLRAAGIGRGLPVAEGLARTVTAWGKPV